MKKSFFNGITGLVILLTQTGMTGLHAKDHLSEHPKLHKHKHKSHIAITAKKYLGVKYKFGGTTKRGIDCSGLTQKVAKSNGKKLPRTSGQQIKIGKKISKSKAQQGDLIFFGDSNRRVGHVGIIIDPIKKTMIHASSAKGKVVISSYNTEYYRKKFRGIRRV